MELLFVTVLIQSKYFISCVFTSHIFISYQITSNKGQYLTHMVSWCSVNVAAISSTKRKPTEVIFCRVFAEWQTELLWKTHFPLKIRAWLPHTLVSRILRAVVSLSDLHDEYTLICFSLCLNSILYWQTHVSLAQIIFMLLINPWIITFIIQRRLLSVRETSQANKWAVRINWPQTRVIMVNKYNKI